MASIRRSIHAAAKAAHEQWLAGAPDGAGAPAPGEVGPEEPRPGPRMVTWAEIDRIAEATARLDQVRAELARLRASVRDQPPPARSMPGFPEFGYLPRHTSRPHLRLVRHERDAS